MGVSGRNDEVEELDIICGYKNSFYKLMSQVGLVAFVVKTSSSMKEFMRKCDTDTDS